MKAPMPSLFLSHGSPMLALEDAPTTKFLRHLSSELPHPKAILIVSAHWETDEPALTGAANPETIYDFHGFPKELYALHYPAKGDPLLARQVQTLLKNSGVNATIDPIRGFDHGAWNPLLLMYPNADIPVIELSVQPNRDAAWHYKIGQILAPLKDDNILIIGTGNLTHNLRKAFRSKYDEPPAWVNDFTEWVADRLKNSDIASLLNWEALAPYALKNHPTPEHFLPFFTALGAGGNPVKADRLHVDIALGVLAMDSYAFR